MSAFDGDHVKIGPGSLYIAPLGTAEPTFVTGNWPTGWVTLGYTDQGSEFAFSPTTEDVTVEEEYFPVRTVTTGYTATLTFSLAESTRRNLMIALNAGLTPSATQIGTESNGTLWAEPPAVGEEVRVMLGWDALNAQGAGTSDPFGRLVARKCFQTGNIQITRRKGSNKALYQCQFKLEKPAGVQPFRMWFPTALAS